MKRYKGRLVTKNLVPGTQVYDEAFVMIDGAEHRVWNPRKSKLGAAIMKGLDFSLPPDASVLYLGAASGTTVSHVSDLVSRGTVFAVEFAVTPFKSLYMLSKTRGNIVPLFTSASNIASYGGCVGSVDCIFMDIAQKDQVDILIKNSIFADENTRILLALKARSVDVTKKPSQVYSMVRAQLKERFDIVKEVSLEPFEKDHLLFDMRMRKTR